MASGADALVRAGPPGPALSAHSKHGLTRASAAVQGDRPTPSVRQGTSETGPWQSRWAAFKTTAESEVWLFRLWQSDRPGIQMRRRPNRNTNRCAPVFRIRRIVEQIF